MGEVSFSDRRHGLRRGGCRVMKLIATRGRRQTWHRRSFTSAVGAGAGVAALRWPTHGGPISYAAGIDVQRTTAESSLTVLLGPNFRFHFD